MNGIRIRCLSPTPGAEHIPVKHREPQALLCTNPDWTPATILTAYLQRWQVEVAFQEVRIHLGVETHRQWSAAAIAGTTPVLLGLSAGSS